MEKLDEGPIHLETVQESSSDSLDSNPESDDAGSVKSADWNQTTEIEEDFETAGESGLNKMETYRKNTEVLRKSIKEKSKTMKIDEKQAVSIAEVPPWTKSFYWKTLIQSLNETPECKRAVTEEVDLFIKSIKYAKQLYSDQENAATQIDFAKMIERLIRYLSMGLEKKENTVSAIAVLNLLK